VRVLNFKKTPSIKLAKKIAKLLNIEWEIFFKD
jgi:DNA-binding XRE family transcriptional regulator